VKGLLDLVTVHFLTKFGRRPQHLLGSYGLGCGCLGLFGLVLAAVLLAMGIMEGVYGLLFGFVAFGLSTAFIVFGGQFLFTGLLAELVVARKMTDMDPYSVAEQTEEPHAGGS
jgi:dolichol-phosphate mannosyltransferase